MVTSIKNWSLNLDPLKIESLNSLSQFCSNFVAVVKASLHEAKFIGRVLSYSADIRKSSWTWNPPCFFNMSDGLTKYFSFPINLFSDFSMFYSNVGWFSKKLIIATPIKLDRHCCFFSTFKIAKVRLRNIILGFCF